MLLLLGVACAAAREAPTSLRVLNDELDGYFRRRLDGEGLEPAPANGTAPPVSVKDLGWCVDNDIDVRFPHWAFNGTLCNSTSCGVNQPSTCQKHSKNRSAKEARKQRRTSLPVPRTSSLGPTRSGTDSTTSISTAGPVRGSRT